MVSPPLLLLLLLWLVIPGRALLLEEKIYGSKRKNPNMWLPTLWLLASCRTSFCLDSLQIDVSFTKLSGALSVSAINVYNWRGMLTN